MGILLKEPSGSLGKCASVKWPARGQNPCVEGERGAGGGWRDDRQLGREGEHERGGWERGNRRPTDDVDLDDKTAADQ